MDKRFWNRVIFREISEESKEAIMQMNKIKAEYQANEKILSEGDPIDHICIIVSGVLKSTEYTIDGKELNSSYFFGEDMYPGGDAFPFYMVYGGMKYHVSHTYCVKKASVIWLPVEELKPIINSDPIFLKNVLTFVSQYTCHSKLLLRCVQYRKVKDRLAYWMTHINDPSRIICIPNSQEVLADILHVNRSSLNQALQSYIEEGIIEIDGKEISVLKQEELIHSI
ncbi:Crp/Fnr family transcriptional regulator [Gallicola sp. Sow4_E12]|uniref:Crp/Fnr family transcriptional regulator n=1 Tax=Gallicola sp. Sow4_E12 TaxID=3438785 RepID=UPI003F922A55